MTDSNNHLLTDEELMEAYKMGHFDAFDILYSRYSSKIRGYIYSKVSSNEITDDLLQQVFFKLHDKRSYYEKKFVFVSWFFTIARNTLTDHFRKSINDNTKLKNYSEEQRHQASIVTTKKTLKDDLEIPLLNHYESLGLTEKQVQVLKLKFESTLNYSEIAELIGSSPVNVRQIISRSLKKIKVNYKNTMESFNEKNNS